jgi:hypothetical protein
MPVEEFLTDQQRWALMASRVSRPASQWDDVPSYEDYVAAGQAERQGGGSVPCRECGVWARGRCVGCEGPVCEDHSRMLDGRLRCHPDATAHDRERPRREAEAAAELEAARLRRAGIERARQEREAEKRAEADRRSRMPVLRGQDLADFLTGKAEEWTAGRVGGTGGIALAEALELAGIPSAEISIARRPGFLSSGKMKFDSEYGWILADIKNAADPDSGTRTPFRSTC